MSNTPPQPSNTTFLLTNVPVNGQTWIILPQSGTLWVSYEFSGEPALQVFIWHQGGSTQPVALGVNTFTVNQGDALVYELGDPVMSNIKLGWGYIVT